MAALVCVDHRPLTNCFLHLFSPGFPGPGPEAAPGNGGGGGGKERRDAIGRRDGDLENGDIAYSSTLQVLACLGLVSSVTVQAFSVRVGSAERHDP